MDSLARQLSQRISAHLGADPLIRVSDHADFQANGALAAARERRTAPRELAAAVAAAILNDDVIDRAEPAGPGFINLTVAPTAIWAQIAQRHTASRLGVATPLIGQRVVVEYSGPNIAKELHVGHLRSTVIGDALARLFRHAGADVIRQNHIGDWGTPFGMLVAYLDDHPETPIAARPGEDTVSRLSTLYRAARAEFERDDAFAAHARSRVVDLQSGDAGVRAQWRAIVAESQRYLAEIYHLLEVELTEADTDSESSYNDALAGIIASLVEQGIAVESEGALCVFSPIARGRDGAPVPLIVQKSDGGFGYAATDLAALRRRVDELYADRICYVVDARQALHFGMVFDTARRAGWLPDQVTTEHVAFGSVLGLDGTPLKTREGDSAKLISLLTAAIDRAAAVLTDRSPDLDAQMAVRRAREIGIGAVKYADLSTGRTRDYVFDLDRMLALDGNTAVYLQYAHARTCSILRKAGGVPRTVDMDTAMEPAERRLALRLDEFDAALSATVEHAEPHRLCGYLFDVAQTLAAFWNACPVLGAPSDSVRANRLVLCDLTARTLRTGLGLLGIAAPERL
ncbi:MAG TPA: arginine--tRNA ligase [Micromonosporaceae bacterium]|nr:arginine--tRNA ligase [Micromonosporaceae bacterium]